MDGYYVYRCEDSMEGIFTAIYDAWASGHTHEENCIEVETEESSELVLFAEYITVVPDAEKSEKVRRSICARCSEEAYAMVMKGVFSGDSEKGEIIYRFLIFAFQKGAAVCKCYGNPWVMKLFALVRNYENEAHHWKGFLRFKGQQGGILVARYAPKNHVLEELMVHFSDRLNAENFLIFDERRNIAGIHEKEKEWYLQRLSEEEAKLFRDDGTEPEESFADLWKIFHHHISIEERQNPDLQRSNLPLRFRTHMMEFIG